MLIISPHPRGGTKLILLCSANSVAIFDKIFNAMIRWISKYKFCGKKLFYYCIFPQCQNLKRFYRCKATITRKMCLRIHLVMMLKKILIAWIFSRFFSWVNRLGDMGIYVSWYHLGEEGEGVSGVNNMVQKINLWRNFWSDTSTNA